MEVFVGMCVLIGLVLAFMIALYIFWFLLFDDEVDIEEWRKKASGSEDDKNAETKRRH